jgi:AGZA family xanthine/uracil permease-like MFS transporter
MLYRVRGAILIGIFLVSIISWPRPTSVTLFPHTEAGDAAFNYFKKVATFHPLEKVGNVLDVRFLLLWRQYRLIVPKYSSYSNGKVWYALITFLYVDILGTPSLMW